MLRVIIPLGIVGVGLIIYSLIECTRTPRHRVRVMSKGVWLTVILLVPFIGAGLWLGFGRAKRSGPGAAPKQPSSPDDDPNFLQNLEIQRRQKQREEELRRKEDELKTSERKDSAGTAGERPALDAGATPEAPKPSDERADDGATGGDSGSPSTNGATTAGEETEGDSDRTDDEGTTGGGRPASRPTDAPEDSDVDGDPRNS